MIRKRLTNETIVAALIAEGSIKGAAASLGCTPRTLYDRMKKEDFQTLYTQARADLLRAATGQLQGKLAGAVATLSEIMDDESAPKQTRANCATSILQYGERFTKATDLLERMERIEEIIDDGWRG